MPAPMPPSTGLESPRVVVIAVAIAVLIRLPALFGPFHNDDVGMLDTLGGGPTTQAAHHELDLYRWFDGDVAGTAARMAVGLVPWYADGEQKLAHFRPVSSGLCWLDYAVCGREPFWPHVHSMLWLVAVVVAAGMFLRRVLSPRVAGAALLIFAVSPLLQVVEWWCCRYALVMAAFGFAGLWAHVRWRTRGWRPGAVLSLGFLAGSLLAGESGVQNYAYLFAYALFGDRGSSRTRALSLLGPTAVLMSYLAVRSGLDYGVARSFFYSDPFHETAIFLANAGRACARTVLCLVVPGKLDLSARWLVRAAMAFAVVLLGIWVRRRMPVRRGPDAAIYWLLLASMVSMVPSFASTAPRAQMLIVPYLGVTALLAVLLQRGCRVVRDRSVTGVRRALTAALWLAVLGGMVLAPALLSSLKLFELGTAEDRDANFSTSVRFDPPVRTAVILRADKFWSLATIRRGVVGDGFAAALTLSIDPRLGPCTVERSGPRTLVLTTDAGSLVPVDDGWRSSKYPLSVDEIELTSMRVRPLEVVDGAVRRAEFQFSAPIDDPTYAFFTLSDLEWTPVALPAVGGQLLLGSKR